MVGSSSKTGNRARGKAAATATARSKKPTSDVDTEHGRAPKRRETSKGKGKAIAPSPAPSYPESAAEEEDPSVDSSASEFEEDSDSDESDVDWENVPIGPQPVNTTYSVPEPRAPLELVLNDPETRKAAGPVKRKITAVERRVRLEIHKMHLMCLMTHVSLRNRWCNDKAVQDNLAHILPDKAYDLLHHDPTDQQYRRSKFFIDGLQQAAAAFAKKFRITHRGMHSAHWQDLDELKRWKSPVDMETLISQDDFIAASKQLTGSRDLGAQLFCAMLRGVGITARLVCSLQVLPFTFANSHHKPALAPTTASTTTSPTSTLKPSLRRPYLDRTLPPSPPPSTSTSRTTLAEESPFPIYWTEAWSPPSQKWIPIDPLVTQTVNKSTKLHPPRTDSHNTCTYILSFDPTAHASDVTLRYTPHFTAKTLPHRITSTAHGTTWYRRLLRHFSRGYALDRDQLEAAELAQKELSEPIPNNIQDFKHHPLFALKRHMRRNEIIHPERKVGILKTKAGVEDVFRRRDVQVVRSAEAWYKEGRVITSGELPVKFTSAPRKPRKRGAPEREEEPLDRPLYMHSQTEIYTPPPVVYGIVPKNKFGNIDVHVPSMIPAGGVHVDDEKAQQAARVLGVDSAACVTGFKWENRAASAVMRGVVVAAEYAEALREVCAGLRWEDERDAWEERMERALERWSWWVQRLKIRERLGMGGERRERVVAEDEEEDEEQDEDEDHEHDEEDGGMHTHEALGQREYDAATAGGFLPEYDHATAGGFIPDDTLAGFLSEGHGMAGGYLPDDTAGGFIPDDDHNMAGGYLSPEKPEPSESRSALPPSEKSTSLVADAYNAGGEESDDMESAGGFLPPTPPPQPPPQQQRSSSPLSDVEMDGLYAPPPEQTTKPSPPVVIKETHGEPVQKPEEPKPEEPAPVPPEPREHDSDASSMISEDPDFNNSDEDYL